MRGDIDPRGLGETTARGGLRASLTNELSAKGPSLGVSRGEFQSPVGLGDRALRILLGFQGEGEVVMNLGPGGKLLGGEFEILNGQFEVMERQVRPPSLVPGLGVVGVLLDDGIKTY